MSSLQASSGPLIRASEPPASHVAPSAMPWAASHRRMLGIAFVTAILLLQAAAQYAAGRERVRVVSHVLFLAVEMPTIMWALSSTFRAAIEKRVGAFRAILSGVLVAGVIGSVFGLAFGIISERVPGMQLHPGLTMPLARSALFGFTYAQMYFGLWALAFVLPFAVEDARIRALEAEKLKSAAELAQLRAHLEPHFLLNTLNAIAGLVTEDPREARRLLACLGDLLRDALRDDDELQSLGDQITWLQRYADILQARHSGSLTFSWDVAADAGRVLLPRLLLQPLVENAVKHGALRRRGGGEVIVRAKLERDSVECVIEDNGPGISDAEIRSGAFGLHAVRRRLELRHAGATLRLESSGAGTRSIVALPIQVAPAGERAT